MLLSAGPGSPWLRGDKWSGIEKRHVEKTGLVEYSTYILINTTIIMVKRVI